MRICCAAASAISARPCPAAQYQRPAVASKYSRPAASSTVAPRPRTPDFDVPSNFSLHEQGAISPWRFEREPPQRAQLWVSAETPWVADEDFGPAVRSKAEARGRPGTLVEFDCRNPDYVVSRVLSAAGSLVLSSPPALRQRIREAAATLARRNGGASGLSAVPTAQEPA